VSTVSGFVLILGTLAILLSGYLAFRPSSTRGRAGKILAFVGLFALPVLVVAFGAEEHIEHSKSTEFCLSCHVMQDYGKSLRVDDAEFVPASHFQNGRIPRDQACYTCHTEYTMYGGLSAKIRGLRHVWAQYLGTIPDSVHLYERYSNRECLHCHAGARSFEEAGPHIESAAVKDSLMSDRKSCMTSGCHDVVHDVHALKDVDLWSSPSSKPTSLSEPKGGSDGAEN
jgi:cytochrome c-type protein NapC